jgi:hypothetical protein
MPLDDTWPIGTASSIHQSHVEQFKDEVIHLAQQMESRLRSCVRTDMVTGKTHNFERLGASAAVAKTTRHTPTPILDLEHSRRKVDMEDFIWADLVDAEDVIRMLIEPKSAYARNAAMAMARQWDTQIITGAFADATDGDGNAVAFTAGQTIGDGTSAITIGDLTDAKYKLDSNEVPFNDRYMVISSVELRDLLNTTEITSADYNTVRALVRGEIDTFLGFKFVITELLPTITTVRNCLAFQKDCLGLAIGSDVKVRTDERKDVSYAWQIFASFSAAATRIDDAGVVKIETLAAGAP